jgi:hypothetical protein
MTRAVLGEKVNNPVVKRTFLCNPIDGRRIDASRIDLNHARP